MSDTYNELPLPVYIGLPTEPTTSGEPNRPVTVREFLVSEINDFSKYSVFVYRPVTGEYRDLQDFVSSIEYSYDDHTPYVEIRVVLVNTTEVSQHVKVGDWLILYGPYMRHLSGTEESNELRTTRSVEFSEIERGQITSMVKSVGDDKTIIVTAKDPTWLLAKNSIPEKIPQGTLIERMRYLESLGYLNYKESAAAFTSSYIIPGTRGGRDSIWEDIMFDLGEVNMTEDLRLILRQRRSEFFIEDLNDQEFKWAFEVGNNIFAASLYESIENYFNEVYVQSTEDGILNDFIGLSSDPVSLEVDVSGYASNQLDFPKFGRHILIVGSEEEGGIEVAQAQANNLLKRTNKIEQLLSVDAFNINGLKWGDQIIVFEPTLNISGVFFIRGGKHKISEAEAIMSLDIAFDFLLPDEVRNYQAESSDFLMGSVDTALRMLGADISE